MIRPADADTNVYLSIDGLTYNYDANDNQTFDPTTGMYKRYDYMGRLVAEDNIIGCQPLAMRGKRMEP